MSSSHPEICFHWRCCFQRHLSRLSGLQPLISLIEFIGVNGDRSYQRSSPYRRFRSADARVPSTADRGGLDLEPLEERLSAHPGPGGLTGGHGGCRGPGSAGQGPGQEGAPAHRPLGDRRGGGLYRGVHCGAGRLRRGLAYIGWRLSGLLILPHGSEQRGSSTSCNYLQLIKIKEGLKNLPVPLPPGPGGAPPPEGLSIFP